MFALGMWPQLSAPRQTYLAVVVLVALLTNLLLVCNALFWLPLPDHNVELER